MLVCKSLDPHQNGINEKGLQDRWEKTKNSNNGIPSKIWQLHTQRKI